MPGLDHRLSGLPRSVERPSRRAPAMAIRAGPVRPARNWPQIPGHAHGCHCHARVWLPYPGVGQDTGSAVWIAGQARGCPVNLSFTIGIHGAPVSMVHAILGIPAPRHQPSAGIPTVAWTTQKCVNHNKFKLRLTSPIREILRELAPALLYHSRMGCPRRPPILFCNQGALIATPAGLEGGPDRWTIRSAPGRVGMDAEGLGAHRSRLALPPDHRSGRGSADGPSRPRPRSVASETLPPPPSTGSWRAAD